MSGIWSNLKAKEYQRRKSHDKDSVYTLDF